MNLLKLRKPTLNHQPQAMPLTLLSLKKAYKSVDKKVELAEKACEKRMKAKVAEVKKEAQAEIRKAEKKASEKISLAKDEIKSVKDTGDLFVRDYGFGSVAVVSKYAEEPCKIRQAFNRR